MSHVLLNSQHAGLSRSVLQDLVQMSLGHVLLSNQHAALSCSVVQDLVWTSLARVLLSNQVHGRIFLSLCCRP